MREGLTILAILLILALTAALVGPYFVDWTAHRSFVEAKLSQALGTRVTVAGPIDLKLLPSPRLTLSDVAVGGSSSQDAPITVKQADVELGVTDLLRGEVDFTEAAFEGPRVKLVMSATGALAFPPGTGRLEEGKIQFERISVRHGTLIVEAAGQRGFMLREIALDAQASSLLGPYGGAGSVLLRGRPTTFHFSTGAFEQGRLRLKMGVDATAEIAQAELDGSLVFPGAPGGNRDAARPAYEGNLTLYGGKPLKFSQTTLPVPWRWSGNIVAGLGKVTSDSFDLRLGEEQQPSDLTGAGEIELGAAPHVRVSLKAKQFDADRLLATTEGGVVRPVEAAGLLRSAIDAFGPGPNLPVSLDVDVGMLILGGDGLTDIHAELGLDRSKPLAGRLQVNGPGHSRLVADGTLEAGVAAGFEGHVDFAAHDRARLAAWLDRDAPELKRALSVFEPFKDIALSGRMAVSGVGFAGNDLTARLDHSLFTGVLTYHRAVDQDRARLYADVTSEALDIDALPDVGLVSHASADIDLALHIVAKAAKIERLGESSVDSGRFELDLTKSGTTTKLERLSVDGLGGASVEATGWQDATGARLDAGLDAAKLADFANLLHHLMPGQTTDALVARAALLSPAKLTMVLTARPGDVFANATLDGTIGATKISAALHREGPDPDGIVAKLDLDTSETPMLLRQVGLASVPIEGLGPGRIGLLVQGRWSGSLTGSIAARLAGTDVTWQGRLTPATRTLEGTLTLKSANAAPLLQSLALVLPNITQTLPADFSCRAGYQPGRLSMSGIAGSLAGENVAGDLALALAPAETADFGAVGPDPLFRPHLEGELRIDRLAGAALAGLALGLPQPAAAGAAWSQQAFAPALMQPPDSDIALHVGAIDLGWGLVARSATLQLQLRHDLVTIAAAQAGLDGGADLKGSLALRRNGPVATISGHLGVQGLAIDRPFAAGKLGLDIDFTSSGESQDQLMADLAGQGTVTLLDARLAGLDADAMTRVIGAADAEKLPLDGAAVASAMAKETAKGSRDLPRLDFQATLAGGVLRLPSVTLPDPRATILAGATVDLQSMTIETTADMRLVTAPPEWAGSPPQIDVSWKGRWEAPKRDVDTAAFFSGLSARALSINLERLEALDADIRERAFFNRRLRAIQADEERERAAEEARRRSEAAQRQVETKAADAPHPPQTPLPPAGGARSAAPLPTQSPPAAPPLPGLY